MQLMSIKNRILIAENQKQNHIAENVKIGFKK